jgi:hypothetical protein
MVRRCINRGEGGAAPRAVQGVHVLGAAREKVTIGGFMRSYRVERAV